MITTQLELSDTEYSEVQTAAQLLGKSVTDVLHEAVRAFAIRTKIERQKAHIDAAFGMWKDRRTFLTIARTGTKGTDTDPLWLRSLTPMF